MTRKNIIDFCNNEIFTQVDLQEAFYMDCKDVIKTVIEWRRKNEYPQTMTASVDDGALYLNGAPVKRIAPKKAKAPFDEYVDYIEGKILSMQENYYI